jgi:hypothetical protein
VEFVTIAERRALAKRGRLAAGVLVFRNRRVRAWQRLKYLWPPARQMRLAQLAEEVSRGALFPITALELYEAETRLLPWKAFFAPRAAVDRLFRAEGGRPGCRGVAHPQTARALLG